MSSVWMVWGAVAWGQEPVPAEPVPVEPVPIEAPTPVEAPEPEPDVQASEEIVVWGQLAIAKARDAVANQLEDLGYKEVKRKDGATKFRGKYATVTFYEDGRLQVGKVVAGLAAPPADRTEPPPRPGLPERSAPMEPGVGPWFWALPSKAKTDPVRAEILEATRDEVEAYVRVVQRTATEEMLQALPDRLDALWKDGTPLSGGGGPIEGADARRAAVLAFWASRTDTVEGQRAAKAVEAWLEATVQPSAHPITAAERTQYEAMRPDGRTLPE
ncbi:MAG: hypothetical protein R3F59_31810 [Myxococcota bacterium]